MPTKKKKKCRGKLVLGLYTDLVTMRLCCVHAAEVILSKEIANVEANKKKCQERSPQSQDAPVKKC